MTRYAKTMSQAVAEVQVRELKMNDPKLNKVFDKLKPNDTIQLKVSSGISRGKGLQPYTVRSKNTLRNGVEKITMILQGNPTGVKRFLYRRNGKVTFAIGDMAASIDDIKEEVIDEIVVEEPIHPDEQGYIEDIINDIQRSRFNNIKDLIKQTKADKESDTAKGDVRDFTDLMKMASKIKIGRGNTHMDRELRAFNKKLRTMDSYPRDLFAAALEADVGEDAYDYLMMTYVESNLGENLDEMKMTHVLINMQGKVQGYTSNEKDAKEMARRTKSTMHKIKKPITDKTLEKMNALAKTPKELKDLGIIEEVELDEKYDLYHKTFSDAMQHAYDYAKKKLGITVDPKEIDNKVATGPKKPSEGKTNKYRLKGKGGNLQIQVYNKGGSKPFELNMYKEEVLPGHKVEAVEYKFKSKSEAMKAKKVLLKYFNEVGDDDIDRGVIEVDAGNRSMNKEHEEIMKKFRPKVLSGRKINRKGDVLDMKEDLDKEDEPVVKKVVDMLKKASQAHAGQAKDLEKAVKEGKMRVYRVSSRKLQGNIHAKDEKEAEKIARSKGMKGKLTITDRGEFKGQPRLTMGEGTWKYPENRSEIDALKKLMARPIRLGREGEGAVVAMQGLLGDDELFDDFYLDGKKNENGDARKTIIKWFRNRVKKDTYGLGDETRELGKRIGLKMSFVPEENNMTEKLTDGNLSLKETVLKMWQEAKSPEQQAAIAIAKKEKEKKEEPDEGNKFSGELDKARKAGKKTFKVGDKEYKVEPKKEEFSWPEWERYLETKKGSLRESILNIWSEELDEGKMKQLHMMIDDGKTAEEIAKAMKLDLKTVKSLMPKKENKNLTKEQENGKKKMTDTGKEMTPVDLAPKMPKIKNEKNRV